MTANTDSAEDFGSCRNCTCVKFSARSGSKRCGTCGHGSVMHNSISMAVTSSKENEAKLTWKEKIALAKSTKAPSAAYYYFWRNFYVWLVLTVAGAGVIIAGEYTPVKFDRGMSDEWYLYTIAAFGIAVIYSYIAYTSAKDDERRQYASVLCAVNAVACTSYILQYLRLTPTFYDYVGHPQDPSRYFEWLATCPILIYLIAQVTGNPVAYADSTATFDITLIALGTIAAMCAQPYSEFFATLSCCFFFHTLHSLMDMYNKALNGVTGCKIGDGSLKGARFVTFLSWNAFTIVWYIQRSKIVSYQTGEMLFCISDIFAKVFLTLILVNATLEESQNQTASRIQSITSEMEQQMEQSEKLLEKLIPPAIIDQLKSGRATGAEEFQSVTVFFSDISNFPALSSKNSTKDMLASLNKLWQEYDTIAKRWGVYKVETIGDAFLGVSGAPSRVPDHAERATNFAIDIIKMGMSFRTLNNEEIQIRVGLNSGPITAGILGDSNPHWCIVGDTVNTASRMESTSKPGRIHISENTFVLIKDKGFNISSPEVMNIKGKGTMNTYWVNGKN
jgi:class 3 adenylate cyclase/bacteriorhodopsin